MHGGRLLQIGLAVLVPLACAVAAAAAPPALVVVVVIDQMRPERVHAGLPGGLGRLVREGRVFENAVVAHGLSETCPGHAVVLTGVHPARAGIPGNEFFDDRGKAVYCVADPSEDARVFGSRKSGRSPRNLRVTALGDWLKTARPGSRVYSVSGKDRAAIMLGGQRPDGAWWFGRGKRPGFTTSAYYRAGIPRWVEAFNGADGIPDDLPATWVHGDELVVDPARPDDFEGEGDTYGRVSGHRLSDDDPDGAADRLAVSPYLDLLTLDFARELIGRERLGRGGAPDLLALGLSATDRVGHMYGPASHEAADALRRLDLALGVFLETLEKQVGEGGLLVALTADHGVLPLPEWLDVQGKATCPVDGGRVSVVRVGMDLLWRLYWKFSPLRWPRSWLGFAGSQIAVDRDQLERHGVAPEQVIPVVESRLEDHPAVAEVWTPAEIAGRKGEKAELYRNSYVPGRSGDLIVEPAAGCLISRWDAGTSHGTPHLYDRAVPLIFWGVGVEPGVVREPVASVDVGPSLARQLGVAMPADLDGKPRLP